MKPTKTSLSSLVSTFILLTSVSSCGFFFPPAEGEEPRVSDGLKRALEARAANASAQTPRKVFALEDSISAQALVDGNSGLARFSGEERAEAVRSVGTVHLDGQPQLVAPNVNSDAADIVGTVPAVELANVDNFATVNPVVAEPQVANFSSQNTSLAATTAPEPESIETANLSADVIVQEEANLEAPAAENTQLLEVVPVEPAPAPAPLVVVEPTQPAPEVDAVSVASGEVTSASNPSDVQVLEPVSSTVTAAPVAETPTPPVSVASNDSSRSQTLFPSALGTRVSSIERNWQNDVASMEFSDGQITGVTDCHTFTGRYTLGANGQSISIDRLDVAERSCSDPQKKALGDAFLDGFKGQFGLVLSGSEAVFQKNGQNLVFSNL